METVIRDPNRTFQIIDSIIATVYIPGVKRLRRVSQYASGRRF